MCSAGCWGRWALADLEGWPDPEVALIAVLGDLAPVSVAVPADPQGTYSWLPFITANRIGGSDDRVTDDAQMAVDVFAASKGAASKLAEQVRQRLLAAPHVTAEAVIDQVTTGTAPNETPYGDTTKVRRYSATYFCRMRRY